MNVKNLLPCAASAIVLLGIAAATPANAQDQKANQTDAALSKDAADRADKATDKARGQGQSNEKIAQPKRLEDSYPLADEADRAKSAKLLQQLTVDLLSLFNQYKEVHWDLNGPLYLVLHEYYQAQADFYRTSADIFAERTLHIGYSIDGRYSTIARTTSIPDFPSGYVTDNESIKLLIDRVTVLQKEIYHDIRETEKIDPPTSNKLQDLAYSVDKNLWQLRIHLQKPGGLGQDLPWVAQQGQDRAGN